MSGVLSRLNSLFAGYAGARQMTLIAGYAGARQMTLRFFLISNMAKWFIHLPTNGVKILRLPKS